MKNHEVIEFQINEFFTHPIYNQYAASKEGQIFGKKHKIILKQNVNKENGGYLHFSAYNEKGRRFVYECFNGIIEDDKEVDHIDNKYNNQTDNLQLLSHKENVRKSVCKGVKSFNIETREEKKFKSITEASEEIGIAASSI